MLPARPWGWAVLIGGEETSQLQALTRRLQVAAWSRDCTASGPLLRFVGVGQGSVSCWGDSHRGGVGQTQQWAKPIQRPERPLGWLAIRTPFSIAEWGPDFLTAIRDPSALCPLYFAQIYGALLIATDVRVVVAAQPELTPDRATLSAFIAGLAPSSGATFFKYIKRLEPGHQLKFSKGELTTHRFWRAPPADYQFAHSLDAKIEFRRVLRTAVTRVLGSNEKLSLHLSGGLDSTLIVRVASRELQNRNENRRAFTVSGVFPGFSCDERAVIQHTTAHGDLQSYFWDARAAADEGLRRPSRAWPASNITVGGSSGDLAISLAQGASAVISGLGGDDLTHADGVLLDAGAGLDWRSLAAEVGGPRYGWGERLQVARQFARGALSGGVPDGYLRARILTDLGHPYIVLLTEQLVQLYAEHGLELRAPMLDVDLVEFVLRIPWPHRLPRSYPRGLQWQGSPEFIPPAYLARTKPVSLGDLAICQALQKRPAFRALLATAEWQAHSLVDHYEVRRRFDQASSVPYSRRARPVWHWLFRVALVESWLRAYPWYGPPA